MKCLQPIWSKKRNAYVPCNNCYFCKTRKKFEWTSRVLMERYSYDNGFFITLTYNNENLPKDGGVSYAHADYFIDELRKKFKDARFGFSYYLMSEYGGRSRRPHYHMHLLTDAPLSFVNHVVSKLWNKGFIKIGNSTLKSVLYTSAFHLLPKEHIDSNYPRPNFHIISRGLGKSYIEQHRDYYNATGRRKFDVLGFSFNLPPYILHKLNVDNLYSLADLDLPKFRRDFFARSDAQGFSYKETLDAYAGILDYFYQKSIKSGLKNSL